MTYKGICDILYDATFVIVTILIYLQSFCTQRSVSERDIYVLHLAFLPISNNWQIRFQTQSDSSDSSDPLEFVRAIQTSATPTKM